MWEDESYMQSLVENAPELKIVGIIRSNENATATAIGGSVGYTSALTEYVIEHVNESEIVKQQISDEETNVLTGMPFDTDAYADSLTVEDMQNEIAAMSEEEQA